MNKFLFGGLIGLSALNVNAINYPNYSDIGYMLKDSNGQITFTNQLSKINLNNYTCISSGTGIESHKVIGEKVCKAITASYNEIREQSQKTPNDLMKSLKLIAVDNKDNVENLPIYSINTSKGIAIIYDGTKQFNQITAIAPRKFKETNIPFYWVKKPPLANFLDKSQPTQAYSVDCKNKTVQPEGQEPIKLSTLSMLHQHTADFACSLSQRNDW